MNINLIAAIDKNGGIGYKNSIPWKCSEDLKNFKALTTGSFVLMGGKTFESIKGKPLADRFNIVLTTRFGEGITYFGKDLVFVANYDQIEIVMDEEEEYRKELWVCGGATVYNHFLLKKDLIHNFYVTLIHGNFKTDTYCKKLLNVLDTLKEVSTFKNINESNICGTFYTNDPNMI